MNQKISILLRFLTVFSPFCLKRLFKFCNRRRSWRVLNLTPFAWEKVICLRQHSDKNYFRPLSYDYQPNLFFQHQAQATQKCCFPRQKFLFKGKQVKILCLFYLSGLFSKGMDTYEADFCYQCHTTQGYFGGKKYSGHNVLHYISRFWFVYNKKHKLVALLFSHSIMNALK